MAPRDQPHVNPDGTRISIQLPASVHLIVLAIALLFGAIWYYGDEAKLKNALLIYGAILATYSAFYARRAILSARERERRFETIKYSGLLGSDGLAAARTSVYQVYKQFLLAQPSGSERERRLAALGDLAKEFSRALKVRDGIQPHTTQQMQTNELKMIADARTIVDYFEDLAVGLQEGVFDEITARKLLKAALNDFWEILKGYVEQLRTREDDNTLYEHMENLYTQWK